MLNRVTRIKLGVFLVVTVVTLTVVGVSYMRIPRQFGAGVYDVELHLHSSGGLYPSAAVSYRGVDVGVVRDVEVSNTGVVAHLSIENRYRVPSDVEAQVHSASAIGEQYVDLIPKSTDGPMLHAGSVIDADRAQIPVSTGELLSSVQALVKSVPQDDLRVAVDELYASTNGTSGDLERLLSSGVLFQEAADENLQPTLRLIRSSLPVLTTQRRASGEIRSYMNELAGFSSELAKDDAALRTTLSKTAGLNTQLEALYADLSPSLPVLLADLATTGRVVRAYLPNVEHVLIVFPAMVAVVQGLVPPSRFDDPLIGASLDFKTSMNSPPVCTTGFADTDHQRSPRDYTQIPPPTDSYCKIAPDDRRIVRGARNLPCPNIPARGPNAASCGLTFGRVGVPEVSAQGTAAYDPATGRLVGPDGSHYRLADLARHASPARTWRQLLIETTKP